MDQLSNVLQIHGHQGSHPNFQYLDNMIMVCSKPQPISPPPQQPPQTTQLQHDEHHQTQPQQQQDKKPRPPDETPKCPRCDSANTKFCYYNNYSLSQPRYFCKSCRRYWTKGGTLRNVPVGGGCRKNNKRSSSSSSSSTSSPSSPSSSLTSPSVFIKRSQLLDHHHQQRQHQQTMMMMNNNGGGLVSHPFSYEDSSLAFARLQQRIGHFSCHDTSSIHDTLIARGGHQQQQHGSFFDSFRDGTTYHPQEQQSQKNNTFFHNLNLSSYGLAAAAGSTHDQHITNCGTITTTEEDKTQGYDLPYELDGLSGSNVDNSDNIGEGATTPAAAVTTAVKHETVWESTDHHHQGKLSPWGFPWKQVILKGGDQNGINNMGSVGVGGGDDEVAKINWNAVVNGSGSWHGLLNSTTTLT